MPKRTVIMALLLSILSLSSFAENGDMTRLRKTIQSTSSDTSRILAITELAYEYWSSKPDSSFVLGKGALELSRNTNFAKGFGRSYWVIGIYYYNLGNSAKALAYYDSAMLYANGISDRLMMGRLYNAIGQIQADLGDYEKALMYHFQSLKLKEEEDDKIGIGNSYNNIGNIYYRIGNFEKALDYCFKSLTIREAIKDNQRIAATENNIGLIYDKLGERPKAFLYFSRALKSFKENGNQRGVTYTCNDIANAYIREKKYDSALLYLKEGLATAEAMKSKERIVDLNGSFSRYYNTIGDYNKATQHAQASLALASEAGLLVHQRAAYEELAYAASRKNQFKQAYEFQLRFSELTDSIQNEIKIEKALQEEFKFREEKSRLEQEKKDLIYQREAERQQWWLYAVLGVLAGVAAIAYAFYRSFRVTKRATDLLTVQRNELAEKNNVIEEQNKLLQEAKSLLEQNIEKRTQDLKIANHELVNQNLQLEQFTFMTAHNLRSPVARLIGLSSLYDFSNPSEPFNAEVVKRIQQSSADLDEVIRDMTIILRTKSGIGDTFVILNLADTMKKVLGQLQEEIAERNIKIINELDPLWVVDGIAPYVHSIFYNVISNSIKYCETSRPPEIRISATRSEHQLVISLTDNGVGFNADENREKLFRPFTRFSTVREGKGLGLYLIKIQMESMRGQVTIKSKMNEGTSVILTFQQST